MNKFDQQLESALADKTDKKAISNIIPEFCDIKPHLEELGLFQDSKIVCYDQKNNHLGACRVAFYCQAYSMKNIKVLNCPNFSKLDESLIENGKFKETIKPVETSEDKKRRKFPPFKDNIKTATEVVAAI